MLAKTIAATCGAALLAGCARDAAPLRLTADHPASPDATAAPLPPPSATLAVGRDLLPAATGGSSHEAGPSAPTTHPAGHEGHR